MNVSRLLPLRALAVLVVLGLVACLPLLLTGDSRSRLLAVNTVILATSTCVIALPLGTVLALLVLRTDMPGRRWVGLLLGTMLFMPLYIQAAAWQAGFGRQGWYRLAYVSLGVPPPLDGWRGAIWIHAMAAIPWVALIVGLGLWFVRPELEEEALLDGTSGQVFFCVTLRRALASVGAAALWALVTTAGEMTVTDLFQIRTYAEEIYTGFALGDNLEAAPLGVMPGAAIVVWLVVAALLVCQWLAPSDFQAAMRPPRRFQLGPWRVPATLLVTAALLLAVGVPLISLCLKAGIEVKQVDDQRVRVWSAMKLVEIVAASPWKFRREFGWSLAVGVLTAVAALMLAVPLAWRARGGGLRALPALAVTAVCLAVPGPMVGVGLIWLLNRPDSQLLVFLYDRTILAPCAAALVRSLPVAILAVWHALGTISPDTLQSAVTEGAGPLARLCRIALPQRKAALGAAWLAALAVAMGDLAASQLVLPPGVDPLARRIFGMLHAGVDDYVAGICLTTAGIFLLIGLAAMWLARRCQR